MATYGSRIDEMQSDLQRVHPSDVPPEKAEAERYAMKSGIERWASARDRILEDLANIAANEDPGSRTVDTWRSRVSSWSSEWSGSVVSAESGISDATSAVFLWSQKLGVEEAKFFEYLAKAEVVADTRDFVSGWRKEIERKTADLEESWSKLTEAHQSFGGLEMEAIKELEKIAEETATLIASQNKQIGERVAAGIKLGTSVAKGALPALAALGGPQLNDAAGQAGDMIIEVLEKGAEAFEAKYGSMESNIQKYQAAMRADRDSVLVMFKGFREQTEQFVRDKGYEQVTKRMEDARRALADFNSNGGATSGLRNDADRFVSQALPKLQSQADRARDLWDNFVRKHEHKFFGALTPDFSKALLLVNNTSWEQPYIHILSQNLNQLAQKFIERPIVELDATDVPENWRGAMREILKASLERYVQVQKKIGAFTAEDALRKAIIGEFQVSEQQLDRFR